MPQAATPVAQEPAEERRGMLAEGLEVSLVMLAPAVAVVDTRVLEGPAAWVVVRATPARAVSREPAAAGTQAAALLAEPTVVTPAAARQVARQRELVVMPVEVAWAAPDLVAT